MNNEKPYTNQVIETWISEIECNQVEQVPSMLSQDALAKHIFTLTVLHEGTKSIEYKALHEAIFKLRRELILMRYLLCKEKIGKKGGEQ